MGTDRVQGLNLWGQVGTKLMGGLGAELIAAQGQADAQVRAPTSRSKVTLLNTFGRVGNNNGDTHTWGMARESSNIKRQKYNIFFFLKKIP